MYYLPFADSVATKLKMICAIVGTHGIFISYTSFIDERSVTDRNPVGSDDGFLPSLNSI